jgi:hypothetical protein
VYPVQVVLDSGDIRAQLAEIRQWFDCQDLAPGAFHYSVGSQVVRLRIEFNNLSDAAAFAQKFAGRVTGLIAEAP